VQYFCIPINIIELCPRMVKLLGNGLIFSGLTLGDLSRAVFTQELIIFP
jgi:hypothetical protein